MVTFRWWKLKDSARNRFVATAGWDESLNLTHDLTAEADLSDDALAALSSIWRHPATAADIVAHFHWRVSSGDVIIFDDGHAQAMYCLTFRGWRWETPPVPEYQCAVEDCRKDLSEPEAIRCPCCEMFVCDDHYIPQHGRCVLCEPPEAELPCGL